MIRRVGEEAVWLPSQRRRPGAQRTGFSIGSRRGMCVASKAMVRLVLLALVAAWIASVVRLARAWRAPTAAAASRYAPRFVA